MKIGCNYWASDSGLKMWESWNSETVQADMELLSKWEIKVIRVFPLWPQFQKLEPIYGGGGKLLEIRGGVDSQEVEKLIFLIEEAGKREIEVIVSLINGWMSGNLFVPAPFYNRNVLTDPEAIKYQVKYVKTLVDKLKKSANIIGWDLGNECNVMAEVDSPSQAWLWLNAIYSAIKSADDEKIVFAGMHGLTVDGEWRIKDAAENCDVLTTHPYPLFTPHCGKDPLGEGRSIYHAAAESKFYSDITGKPCIIEEMGSLGPNVATEEMEAEYLSKAIRLAEKEGIEMLLWWCAFDQPFDYHPYDSIALERELGLFRFDRTPKPIVEIIKEYKPEEYKAKDIEALCLLTEEQDHWLTAYGSFVLAERNNLSIKFTASEGLAEDCPAYMLPCIKGFNVINKKDWDFVLNKVKEGALLYISYDGGFLTEFRDLIGLDIVEALQKSGANDEIILENTFGNGKVILCKKPIENLCILDNKFPNDEYDSVYKKIAGEIHGM